MESIVSSPSYPSQLKYKPAIEQVTSSVALQDDDDLVGFDIGAAAFYLVRGLLIISGAAGDFKYDFPFTNAPQSYSILMSGGNDTNSNTEYDNSAVGGGSIAVPAAEIAVALHGHVEGHATLADTMKLRWAQLTSDVGATTLHQGSWIELVRMS